jgi:hypothetical protein
VVLEGQEIVAHGNDASKVVADAREKGIQVPYVFRVEAPQADVLRIGL